MTAGTPHPAIEAALSLWEHLAAYGWEQQLTFGRGVVLVRHEQLLEAVAAHERGEPPQLTLGYVPATHIPKGDDFLPMILQADPSRQVALLVQQGAGDREEDEQLFILEPAEAGRPSPKECFAQSLRKNG